MVLTNCILFNSNKKNTFRPQKKFNKGSKKYSLHKQAKGTLGSGNLKLAVQLPEEEELNQWLSIFVIDFTNKLNMIYASIQSVCTTNSCPVMNAGPKFEYHWSEKKSRKPKRLSAPDYIEKLLKWVDDQINDENIFPSDPELPYPRGFKNKIVSPIFKRLFRIFGHVYYSHFSTIREMGAEAHLNTLFKHFVYFTHEFNLIDEKELQPMQLLINKLCNFD
ncbi:mob kinase activator-like 1 [Anaeramoeba flamelloides]|uniref:Mob kinase activator-like 1 n=1 Tax=Anaeramoeba flamelloides TaxID=1746091 RepID=A0ABQ8Z6G5_9EUKA|nr:mob kinase activator-like 1 [Anaeramoeba flamelloides]